MPNQAADKDVQLKAGHPPAVKVGNMRVTQRTHSTSSDKHSDEEAAERKSSTSAGDTVVPSACSFAPKTVVDKGMGGVSEAVAHQINQEAVKHIHEKPQVTHELRNQSSRPNVIQQPKK